MGSCFKNIFNRKKDSYYFVHPYSAQEGKYQTKDTLPGWDTQEDETTKDSASHDVHVTVTPIDVDLIEAKPQEVETEKDEVKDEAVKSDEPVEAIEEELTVTEVTETKSKPEEQEELPDEVDNMSVKDTKDAEDDEHKDSEDEDDKKDKQREEIVEEYAIAEGTVEVTTESQEDQEPEVATQEEQEPDIVISVTDTEIVHTQSVETESENVHLERKSSVSSKSSEQDPELDSTTGTWDSRPNAEFETSEETNVTDNKSEKGDTSDEEETIITETVEEYREPVPGGGFTVVKVTTTEVTKTSSRPTSMEEEEISPAIELLKEDPPGEVNESNEEIDHSTNVLVNGAQDEEQLPKELDDLDKELEGHQSQSVVHINTPVPVDE